MGRHPSVLSELSNELVHGWRCDVERFGSARWSLWLTSSAGGGLLV